jgi:peptidoglycan/xylan/chitin deacetylase (PgdA/CDA1 family)
VLDQIKLFKQLGYVYLRAPLEVVLKVLRRLGELRGWSEDLSDAMRILENFDAFYEFMRRKHKEYIAPRKSESDLLSGRVVVDKLKLEVDGSRFVTLVFDKRVGYEEILNVLRELGLPV